MEYKKSKFYCNGESVQKDYSIWWEDQFVVKRDFRMTNGYRKFLKQKRIKALEDELVNLRHKLEWQMATYGQVDEIDLQEFLWKVEEYPKIIASLQ